MNEPDPEREARIEAIVEAYLDALQAGEAPDRRALLAAHPEIADALTRRLDLVAAMHRLARSESAGADEPEIGADGRAIRVRCPHCGQAIQLVEPVEHEVTCRSCGTSFPVDPSATLTQPPARTPRSLGKFRVLGVLGRGTFGTVYRAADPDLGRVVAVKVPRAGYFATDEEEERFLREARSAARLHHPGVVKVLEVGRDGGVPFIVSDFIDGPTLADRLTAGRPGPREAAELVARVADALAYAHAAGVVHRDVKPSNILLDPAGRPLLADFGLARRDEAESVVTLDGQVLGTPAYMAPEQAAGDQRRVGPRSDVYSLGVVLYVLLTGEFPFRGNSRMLIHQVLHDDPKPPRSLDDKVPRDLETICLKAMVKEPTRRYETAAELAADLRRFLAGEPIRARRVGSAERAWRWCRRNPVVAGLISAVVASLAIGFAISTRYARLADARAEETRRMLYASRMNQASLNYREGSADLVREALEATRAAPGQADLRGWEWRYLDRLAHDELRTVQGGHAIFSMVTFSPDGRLLAAADDLTRVRLWRVSDGQELPLVDPVSESRSVEFSPDGRWLAGSFREAEHRESVKLWRLGHPQQVVKLPMLAESVGAEFHPDGQRIALFGGKPVYDAGTSGVPGFAQLWDLATRRPVLELPGHTDFVLSLAFAASGRRIATGCSDGFIRVWDADQGTIVRSIRLPYGKPFEVALSPDGRLVAATDDASVTWLWDVDSGKRLNRISVGSDAVDVRFSPSGTFLATTDYDSTVKLWDAAGGSLRATLPGTYDDNMTRWDFARDGRWAVTLHGQEALIHDVGSGRQLRALRGHTDVVDCAEFSPDGRLIATAGDDAKVRLWDAPGIGGVRTLEGAFLGAAFSPDGRSIATVGPGKTCELWDRDSGRRVRMLAGHSEDVQAVAFSGDGRRLVSGDDDGTVRIWSVPDGIELTRLDVFTGSVDDLAVTPDLHTIAAIGFDRRKDAEGVSWKDPPRLVVRGLAGRGSTWQPGWKGVELKCLAFSPDGRYLAVAGVREAETPRKAAGRCAWAEVWDVRSRRLVSALPPQSDGPVRDVAFSRDGCRLALGCGRIETGGVGSVILWDIRAARVVGRLRGHEATVWSVGFSPEDDRVVTASNDGTVRIWDPASGQRVLSLSGSSDVSPFERPWAAFSPDGHWLALRNEDGIVLLDGRLRSPSDRVEREALGLVDFLFRRPLLKADVEERIRSDPTITEEVRRVALGLAGRCDDDPDRIVRAGWDVVAWPVRTKDAYRVALRTLEVSVRAHPDHPGLLTSLGAAHYRLGDYAAALDDLNRSDALSRQDWRTLAFLTMTQQRIGQRDAALSSLGTLYRTPSAETASGERERRLILNEVQATIHPPVQGLGD